MLAKAVRVVLLSLAFLLVFCATMLAAIGPPYVVVMVAVVSLLIVVLTAISVAVARSLRYQWPAIILVALAAMGLTVMGSVASLTTDTFQDGGVVDRVCGPDGLFHSCHQAIQSRWSSLPLGFGPRAPRISYVLLGLVFYSTLLVWFLVVGRPKPAERWRHLFPLLLTAAGTGIGIYLTVILFTQLGGACPLCLMSHVVTTLIFILVATLARPGREPAAIPAGIADSTAPASPAGPVADLRAKPRAGARISSWRRPALAIVLAGVMGFAGIRTRDWNLRRQHIVSWKVLPEDSVRGPKSAPFVAIVYSDFQCPECRDFAGRLEEARRRYPEQIRLVFRHYPLNHCCNSRTTTDMHLFSCQAAGAAEAARRLGGEEAFWKMHDALFAHQAELATELYAKLAEQIGLDAEQFLAEMNSPQTSQRIKAHVDSSARFKVRSTPTAFLNGRRLWRWESSAFWQDVIENPDRWLAPGATTTRQAKL